MVIGVGFDPMYASSSPLPSSSSYSSVSTSSGQYLGSKRILSSAAPGRTIPLHVRQSRSSCVWSPSLLQSSITGIRSSSELRARKKSFDPSSEVRAQKKSLWNGARVGNLGSVKKFGCLSQNSLFGNQLNFVDSPREDVKVLQRYRALVRAASISGTSCEVTTGFFKEKYFGVHTSFLSRLNRRSKNPWKRALSVANCGAEGGGVSYDDRIGAVESDSEGSSGVDKNGQGNPGRELPDQESDASIVANGKSGGVVSQSLSDGLPISEILQKVREDSGEESAVEVMKEILRVAKEDLEKCRCNSEKFEEKAQSIAVKAISLKDEASEKEKLTNAAASKLEKLVLEEATFEEELEKALASKAVAADLLRIAEAELEDALRNAKVDGEGVEKEEGSGQESVEAKVEVTTERTVDVSVKPVNGDASADQSKTVAKIEVLVQGENAETAVAIATAILEEREGLESARARLRDNDMNLERIEAELARIRGEKVDCELEVERLSALADKARDIALAADDDVAQAMAEAEQAVALELEAAQRVGDAGFAIQKAESYVAEAAKQATALVSNEAEKLALSVGKSIEGIEGDLERKSDGIEREESTEDGIFEGSVPVEAGAVTVPDAAPAKEQEEDSKPVIPSVEVVPSTEKTFKESEQDTKKIEPAKEPVKEPPLPKVSKKRSSRFFAASYFSSDDGEEFSPGKAYAHIATALKPHFAKILIGAALLFAGGAYMNNRLENRALLPQLPAYTTSIEQANASTKPIVAGFKKLTIRLRNVANNLAAQEVSEEEVSLFDVLWLLLASVVFVPLFMKIPGGSPVLGYLVAGVLIGPHTIHIIKNVHGTKAIAEFGVVFLLFNIGLELSVERLSSMKKYVFGLGTTQVFATAAGVGVLLNYVSKITGPPAIIIASGLALSSTAVVLQVLQERGESTSRHGRATFSVLLFQDLAVVVLLILIPLLSAKGGVGLQEIGAALGVAGIKAIVAIVAIIASGRLFLRPIYKQMADNQNAEIFAANTLLVVLGTSVLTARAGLSMALGAFLAGLLLAETEFALQVESDIAPYRGLLLGLFFMTVGMSIDPKLLVAKFPEIATALAMLIVGKTVLVAAVGRLFGLSPIAAVRTGLLLAPGGEFAFVAFGEAVNQGILSSQLSSLLFLVVGLSMALTPWLAAGGQLIAARFEQQDVRSLLPQENETDDLQGHIIICGFGRVGQIIAQLLSERLIPFVALDVRSDRVSIGRQLDLPVYFGDAGSKEVLHKVGAERAAAAVITLDTPGANYRTVWALSKHFPNVKTFVRAHDVDHGITLEKAGATAVVPETLEPSLQLAAAVLAQAKVPAYEIASAIDEFRNRHLSELAELTQTSGTSLGYGFSRMMTKPLLEAIKIKSDDEDVIEKLVEGNIVAVP